MKTPSEESNAEICSHKPLSVQSESKFPKICITDKQKSVKRKIMRQNHAFANNGNDFDKTYSPKM